MTQRVGMQIEDFSSPIRTLDFAAGFLKGRQDVVSFDLDQG